MNETRSGGTVQVGSLHSATGTASPASAVARAPVTSNRHKANWVAMWRLIALGSLGGLVAGFVAGLWLRLAMRISGILTVDRNQLIRTEADARVGEITLEGTLFLVFSASSAGIFGGVLYVAIRHWLPQGATVRSLSFGALLLAVFGFFVIDEHNPDFALFGPVWLNVGMYSLTYIIYGAIASLVVERLDAHVVVQGRVRLATTRSRLAMTGLTPFALLGLVLSAALAITGLGIEPVRVMLPLAFVGIAITLANRFTPWRRARNAALTWFAMLAIAVPALTGVFLTVQGYFGILSA